MGGQGIRPRPDEPTGGYRAQRLTGLMSGNPQIAALIQSLMSSGAGATGPNAMTSLMEAPGGGLGLTPGLGVNPPAAAQNVPDVGVLTDEMKGLPNSQPTGLPVAAPNPSGTPAVAAPVVQQILDHIMEMINSGQVGAGNTQVSGESQAGGPSGPAVVA